MLQYRMSDLQPGGEELTMFEEILRYHYHIERYRTAPLAQERGEIPRLS